MTESFFSKKCIKCDKSQTKFGMCWDDSLCGKCYYGESMTFIKEKVLG